ncbi:FadR/GntR family transcriptional regulator [Streptomyces albus]
MLVEQLGVGRNTVREAVRALVHTGLLEPRQGDGTYVRSRSELAAAMQRRLRRSAALDAYEVRASLERDAARYAALRRTDDDLAALRAALGGRTRAWQAQDTEALIEADVTFHQKVAAAAHNPVLAELYDYFSDALRSTLSSVMRAPLPDAVRLQNAAHVTIVDDAIAARPRPRRGRTGRRRPPHRGQPGTARPRRRRHTTAPLTPGTPAPLANPYARTCTRPDARAAGTRA